MRTKRKLASDFAPQTHSDHSDALEAKLTEYEMVTSLFEDEKFLTRMFSAFEKFMSELHRSTEEGENEELELELSPEEENKQI